MEKVSKNKIIKLWEEGKSYVTIGKIVGCSKQYVSQVISTNQKILEKDIIEKINNMICKGYSITYICSSLHIEAKSIPILNKVFYDRNVEYPVLNNYILFNYGSYVNFSNAINCSNLELSYFIAGKYKKFKKLLYLDIKHELKLPDEVLLKKDLIF